MVDYRESIPTAGTGQPIGLPHALIELGAGRGAITYQIHFHDRSGALLAAHTVHCDGDKQGRYPGPRLAARDRAQLRGVAGCLPSL